MTHLISLALAGTDVNSSSSPNSAGNMPRSLIALVAAFFTAGITANFLLTTNGDGFIVNVRGLLASGLDDQSGATRHFTDRLGASIAALLLTLTVGSAASSAGVGGGAFFVPLFTFLLRFSVKGATSLSQATITGGSLAAVALSIHKRHPVDPSCPLIDYNLSLMLLPALLLGVSVGVLANTLFPNWLITLQLTLLLLYLTYLTARKAVCLHRAEQRAAMRRREAAGVQSPGAASNETCQMDACSASPEALQETVAAPAAETGAESQPVPPDDGGLQHPSCSVQVDGVDCSQGHRQQREHIDCGVPSRHRELYNMSRTPWVMIAKILGLYVAFLAMQLLKSKWQKCTMPFIVIYSIQGSFCVGTSILFLHQAHKSQLEGMADHLNRPILEDIYTTVTWTLPRLMRASVITLVAGVVAGLLGIGGGMLVGPLLLELGVHPLISAATSSLMVLFSASTAMLSFAFEGSLNTEFALIFGLSCLLASLLGVVGIARVVRKSGKASILVMLLAGIIGAGAILTAVLGGRSAIDDLRTGHDVAFSAFCSSSS